VSWEREEPPWDELDESIIPLIRTLNELPGIHTLGSCGGHETPISGNSAPADQWWVLFDLEPADHDGLIRVPTPEAWMSLEFLAYYVDWRGLEHEIALRPYANPP
jgi:hypothetical protein